jgi:hypothetical protein
LMVQKKSEPKQRQLPLSVSLISLETNSTCLLL